MALEQDLVEARARHEYWQTQHSITWWGIGICVAVCFFSFVSAMSAPLFADVSGQRTLCGASIVFGLLFVGYGVLAEERIGNAAAEIGRINHAISVKKGDAKRKRTQERKRKNQEHKRKRDLEQRERELEGAKKLMEEGGLDNLNKAIRIFKKYEK
jgi:hypothetical protein